MMDSSIELLAAQRLAEAGLSPAELLSLDMAEYARLTGRPTIGQIAAQAVETEAPGTPRQAPAQESPAIPAPPAADAQGLDVNAMTLDQYAAVRGQLGMGGREYGRGIFDGGGTAEWIAAAQAKGGRHGWQGQNVEEAPQLGRAYVQQEQPPAYRSAADRFATPGNVFGS